jgi:glutamine cyclotransferase
MPAPVIQPQIVAQYPHDREAFTQGLIYRGGFLYESTGLNGKSSIRRVRLETGEVLQRQDVERRYFAEGMTELAGELYQLTWDNQVGFVYDMGTLEQKRVFRYRGEGWGLTHDGTRLILSDGSPVLRFFEPETMKEISRLLVTEDGKGVEELNELELVRGQIWANVWLTARIAVIDPISGRVTAWIDMSKLEPGVRRDGNAVLNGIAWDPVGDRLFVTGKLWPTLFEVQVPR